MGQYADRALSASKETQKRAEFNKMLLDSAHNKFDAVLVYKLDRFSRDRYDFAVAKNKLKKNGVRLLSATENISDSPEGIILESLLEGMAEYYSAELSQKVQRGMRETAIKCNSTGGTIPFGYKVENKKLVIDEPKAQIVREAFRRYADGESMADLIRDFTERGIKTSKGNELNKSTFTRMFKSRKYIGEYSYGDIVVEDGIPAIVDIEAFEKVQKKLELNKRTPGRNRSKVRYLLSAKMFCGHCGNLMIGESGKSCTGNVYYYYTCSGRKTHKNGCKKKTIQKDVVEKVVAEDCKEWLTPERIEEIAELAYVKVCQDNDRNLVIDAIEQSIKDIDKKLGNIIRAIETAPESEALFDRLKALEEEKKTLVKQLEWEKKQVIVIEKDMFVWYLGKFANMDIDNPEERAKILDLMVNQVTVWDEGDKYRLRILINLKEGNDGERYAEIDKSSCVEASGSP